MIVAIQWKNGCCVSISWLVLLKFKYGYHLSSLCSLQGKNTIWTLIRSVYCQLLASSGIVAICCNGCPCRTFCTGILFYFVLVVTAPSLNKARAMDTSGSREDKYNIFDGTAWILQSITMWTSIWKRVLPLKMCLGIPVFAQTRVVRSLTPVAMASLVGFPVRHGMHLRCDWTSSNQVTWRSEPSIEPIPRVVYCWIYMHICIYYICIYTYTYMATDPYL